ncbi:contractile injection system protein, VgrG/Pvc8 family, partial [Pseudomonas aeruginosa]|uniref:contractile injection system protein, VgrG/Pvc8 family n=2 Tax=Pseudomonas TaxID=286 RepID=UPI00397856F4
FDALGAAHPYHGIVTSVELLDADDLYHYCRVVLEPRITRLRQQRFSEIWLDKNLPELLRDILKNADLTREGQGADSTRTAAFDFD